MSRFGELLSQRIYVLKSQSINTRTNGNPPSRAKMIQDFTCCAFLRHLHNSSIQHNSSLTKPMTNIELRLWGSPDLEQLQSARPSLSPSPVSSLFPLHCFFSTHVAQHIAAFACSHFISCLMFTSSFGSQCKHVVSYRSRLGRQSLQEAKSSSCVALCPLMFLAQCA